jgi:hypothetical protein
MMFKLKLMIIIVLGKSLAYTRVDFFNAKDQLCAYGGESV